MTAGKISKRVLARVNGDSIVLLHDRGQTVEALRPIIRGLEGKNAKFVPLSEIMRNKSHRKLLYP